MLKTRVISGAILALILFVLLIAGGTALMKAAVIQVLSVDTAIYEHVKFYARFSHVFCRDVLRPSLMEAYSPDA